MFIAEHPIYGLGILIIEEPHKFKVLLYFCLTEHYMEVSCLNERVYYGIVETLHGDEKVGVRNLVRQNALAQIGNSSTEYFDLLQIQRNLGIESLHGILSLRSLGKPVQEILNQRTRYHAYKHPKRICKRVSGQYRSKPIKDFIHPQTPSNSRHSPLLMPLSSCVTTSPASRRFNTEIALADSVTPPIR